MVHKVRIVVHLGQDHFLQVSHQPVVFRVEDVMDGGQADVLVTAPIAGDVVSIEQLVIVIAARIRAVEIPEADLGIAVRDPAGRKGIVRDVVQEGMSGAGRAGRADGMGRVVDEGSVGHRELGISIGSALEAPIRVDLEQGNVGHIGIGQVDPEQVPRLRLDLSPRCQAAVVALEESPGGDRTAGPIRRVFAQEDLVRGMRGVCLVLIDERCRLIDVFVDIVGRFEHPIRPGLIGRPRQHHEVGPAAVLVKWVVGLQRDGHRSAPALVDEIQSMIEELTEECEPLIERRRSGIRPLVRNNAVAVDVDRRGCGVAGRAR